MPHAATSCATLPLAGTVARLRAVEAAADRSSALRAARSDLRWALIERARAIQSDYAALEAAITLADGGDAEAIEALNLADELDVEPPPRSISHPEAIRSWPERLVAGLEVPEVRRLDDLVDALAEQRRHGVPFDSAWASAVARLEMCDGELGSVLRDTKEAWRCAYCRQPAPPGLSLTPWGG